MKRPVLLDSSFLIDLERETASATKGPASAFLPSLRGRPLVVSVITVAELLEGAADAHTTLNSLQRFSIQGLHLAHAQGCARLQRRPANRLGDNDAWLVATADVLGADLLGADRSAFLRLGSRYLQYR